MSDTSQNMVKAGGGVAKASIAALYMDLCQHVTPPLAGYLAMWLPFLGENLSFEFVVFAQATLAAAIVKWTPQHFVDSVTGLIRFWRQAFKQWREAANQP